jgi:hypothetical protein
MVLPSKKEQFLVLDKNILGNNPVIPCNSIYVNITCAVTKFQQPIDTNEKVY